VDYGIPQAVQTAITAAATKRRAPTSLRTVLTCGEMILASLVERFAPHRRIILPLLLIRSTLIQVALEVAEEVRDGGRCPGF